MLKKTPWFWIAAALIAMFGPVVFAADETSQYQSSQSSYSAPSRGAVLLSIAGIGDSQLKSGSQSKQVGLGAGALVEFEANRALGLETGALYVNRVYQASAGGATLTAESHRLQVPVLLRAWPATFFSVGAGPFVSFKTSGIHSAGTAANDLATSANRTAEFGLEGAATFDFPVYKKTGLFLEARLSDTLGRNSDEDAWDTIGLLGLKFDIGG